MWRDFYKMEFCIEDGAFYSRLHNTDGETYYNLPIADNMTKALNSLVLFNRHNNIPSLFCTIPGDYLKEFENSIFTVDFYEQEDFFDYLYYSHDMRTFAGRKFSGQRNQTHKFKRPGEPWSFSPLTEDNTQDVKKFFMRYVEQDGGSSLSAKEENAKVMEVLDNPDIYKMQGGVLTLKNEVVGFSLGETVHDTLFVHIEKADRNVPGAYQTVVNEFAKLYTDEKVLYINREEDMGDEGLRASKSSYHPLSRLRKYIVEAK